MNPTVIATAQVMVANRLIEPLSDWGQRRMALT